MQQPAAHLKRSAALDFHSEALKARGLKLPVEPCERDDVLPYLVAAISFGMVNFATAECWPLWPRIAIFAGDQRYWSLEANLLRNAPVNRQQDIRYGQVDAHRNLCDVFEVKRLLLERQTELAHSLIWLGPCQALAIAP
jgi:hypothetical protein